MTEAKILDFLDGRLSGADEEELLHLLAVSPERRILLRSHMMLRETIHAVQHSEKLAVPCSVTASVFAQLESRGFTASPNATLRITPSVLERFAPSVVALTSGGAPMLLEEEKRTGWRAIGWLRIGTVAAVSFLAGLGSLYLYDHPGAEELAVPKELVQNSAMQSSSFVNTEAASDSKMNNLVAPAEHFAQRHASPRSAVAPAHRTTFETALAEFATSKITESATVSPESANSASANSENLNSESSAVDIASSYEAATEVNPSDLAPTRTLAASEATKIAAPLSKVNFLASHPSISSPKLRAEENWAVERVEIASPYWLRNVAQLDPIEHVIQSSGIANVGNFPASATIRDFSNMTSDERMAPFSMSLRAAAGPILGRRDLYSASFSEFRMSWRLGDWLIARASAGQLLPYESEAEFAGVQSGVAQLRSVRALKFIPVVGGGFAMTFSPLGLPLELGVSLYSDMGSKIYPKGEINATIPLTQSVALTMGLEALMYRHSIDPSLNNLRYIYRRVNPAVKGTMVHSEWDGYIGPSVEIAWHF